MKIYEKYVYLTICEESLKLFKDSNYLSYESYCRGMDISLKNGELSRRECAHLNSIIGVLNRIFSMSNAENAMYISKYFALESHFQYQKCVVLTKEVFGNCFN